MDQKCNRCYRKRHTTDECTFLKYENEQHIIDIKTIEMLYKKIEENINETKNKECVIKNEEKKTFFNKITEWCKNTSLYYRIWLFDYGKNNYFYFINDSVPIQEKIAIEKNKVIEEMFTKKRAFKLFQNDTIIIFVSSHNFANDMTFTEKKILINEFQKYINLLKNETKKKDDNNDDTYN